MKRFARLALAEWAKSPTHRPLLLRGARQVGKTYLVESFAERHFEQLVTLNLEKDAKYAECFSTFKPDEIIQKISAVLAVPIIPGKTLLFVDEIQACPRAIQALRYFKEEMPALHVIAAGSLLEFALNTKEFKMPVGRVQYLYLKLLSFLEYLTACDKSIWCDAIQSATLENPVPMILHETLCQEIKKYIAIGGMPAVVDQYINEGSGSDFRRMQMSILETYVDDFAKYATSAMQSHIKTVFDQMPLLLGQQTKYNKIDPVVHSRFLKEAIQCLQLAGVIYQVYGTSASGIPISALVNLKKYKCFFLDVGLMVAKTGLSPQVLMGDDILAVNQGEMAEQFVCQELLAYSSFYQRAELFYWSREKKGASAEVDFVTQYDASIVPIEVKAGSVGRLKSLQVMMQEKNYRLVFEFHSFRYLMKKINRFLIYLFTC